MEKHFRELHELGLTDLELSNYFKINRRAINEYRRNLKLSYNFPNSKYIKKIIELSNLNYKDSEIAKELNISDSTVSKYRRDLNLPRFMQERTYKNQYDRIRGYMIRNVKFSAKRRNIDFNLNFTEFDLPEYCPILNLKLQFIKEGGSGNDMNHATIDRIDNSKGYVKGNVIVISRLANVMKNEANFEQLETFSKNINKLINYYKIQGALGSITDVFKDCKLKFSLDS